MNNLNLQGALVICTDNHGAESLIKKNEIYRVEAALHSRRLFLIEGIETPLAANRFKPFPNNNGESEKSNVCS